MQPSVIVSACLVLSCCPFLFSKGVETYGNRWALDGSAELEANHWTPSWAGVPEPVGIFDQHGDI
jgi:hypothetical protein